MAKKTTAPKTAQQTIEEMRAELEAKQKRLKGFEMVLNHLDSEIEWRMIDEYEKEGYRDENGEWHQAVLKLDADGNAIRHAPTEGDWTYEEYTALCAVRDEILTLL